MSVIKRLENYELIKKIVNTVPPERLGEYVMVVLDRRVGSGLREVRLSEVVRLMRDRVILGDAVIPLHRVVEIRRSGEVLWRRGV